MFDDEVVAFDETELAQLGEKDRIGCPLSECRGSGTERRRAQPCWPVARAPRAADRRSADNTEKFPAPHMSGLRLRAIIVAVRAGLQEVLQRPMWSFASNPACFRDVRYPLPAQSVDATQALNLSAGVSYFGVSRGRSLSCRPPCCHGRPWRRTDQRSAQNRPVSGDSPRVHSYVPPTRHPFIRKLPVQLPIISGPTGILTLKNRELNPAAQVFMECAREVAKPLRRRR